jgi:diguanylate cyclase (GGDEF)-like protein
MTKDDLIVLQQKVTMLRAEGKYKDTIESCYELLDNGMQIKDYKSVLTAYLNLIASYYCVGDMETAFNILSAYEEACDNYGDEVDKLNLYNVLFLLYDYTKDYSMAKATLEKSIALGKKLKKYNIVSNGYSNYSHVCMLEENYAEAFEMASTGLEMGKLHEPSSRILELRVELNIAKSLLGLGKFHDSKRLIDKLIKDPVLDSFIREKAQCHDLYGHWCKSQKLYREAMEAFTEAKLLVESYGDDYLLKSIQEERCRLCELLGEYNLGYEIQKEYITLLKEINDKELALTALKLEMKLGMDNLRKITSVDPLTGIYNRSFVKETADDWLKEAKQTGSIITCMVIDIDNFKTINDKCGHLFGDEVIKRVCNVLLGNIRESDILGRYGGDEFIVLSRDISLESAKVIAEQLLNAVRNLKLDRDEEDVSITLSIGISDNSGGDIASFGELFNAADKRLYEAKRKGKDAVVG